MDAKDEWEDPGNAVINITTDEAGPSDEADEAASPVVTAPFDVRAAQPLPPAPRSSAEEPDWVDPGQPAVADAPFWPDL